MTRTLAQIFAIPAVLAVVSGIGLVAALLTDGPADLLWTAVVAVPVAMIAWALARRRA